MRTKLDLIVDYLADRGDGAAEPIRRELAEPASEASLFLEGLRERTRSMLDVVPPPHERPRAAIRHGPVLPAAPAPSLKRWSPLPLAAAATILVAVGVSWRDQQSQIRRLETANVRREQEWRSLLEKLETARAESAAKEKELKTAAQTPRKPAKDIAPPQSAPEPRNRVTELLVARLEAGLTKLEDRLNTPMPGPPPTERPELDLDQLRRELEVLKSDATAREKAIGKDLRELRMTLNQVMIWIRQLADRPPVQVPMLVPLQVPAGPLNLPNMGNNPGVNLPQSLEPFLGRNPQHPGTAPQHQNHNDGQAHHPMGKP